MIDPVWLGLSMELGVTVVQTVAEGLPAPVKDTGLRLMLTVTVRVKGCVVAIGEYVCVSVLLGLREPVIEGE